MERLRKRPDYIPILEKIAVHSSILCLTSRADGQITWCNRAFEDFIGYTVAEFVTGKVDWKTLTPITDELNTDEDMVALLQSGQRSEYTIYKSYQPNGKPPTRCKLNVYAWPNSEGIVEEFIVIVWPLVNGQLLAFEHTMNCISKLRTDIDDLLIIAREEKAVREAESNVVQSARLIEKLTTEYPLAARIIALLTLIIVLGDTGAELVLKLIKALGWLPAIEVPAAMIWS